MMTLPDRTKRARRDRATLRTDCHPTGRHGATPEEVDDDGAPEQPATTPEWKAGSPQRATIVD
jgi:hypothetical protein